MIQPERAYNTVYGDPVSSTSNAEAFDRASQSRISFTAESPFRLSWDVGRAHVDVGGTVSYSDSILEEIRHLKRNILDLV